MGASSVTGISGKGAVKGMKGPGNDRNFWVPNVCPHILAAGEAEVASGTVTVVLPQPLEKPAASYVVLLTAVDALGDISVAKTEASSKMTGFTVTAAADGTVGYVVVNMGYGIEATTPDGR